MSLLALTFANHATRCGDALCSIQLALLGFLPSLASALRRHLYYFFLFSLVSLAIPLLWLNSALLLAASQTESVSLYRLIKDDSVEAAAPVARAKLRGSARGEGLTCQEEEAAVEEGAGTGQLQAEARLGHCVPPAEPPPPASAAAASTHWMASPRTRTC